MTALLRDGLLSAMSRSNIRERLIVTPLLDSENQVGPGSIDLRLGTEFLEFTRGNQTVVDPMTPPDEGYDRQVIRQRRTYVPLGDGFILHPGQFVLGSTLEFVGLPADLVGQVLSRSSWGRLGLLVATAVSVQPGFRGVLTLELVNTGGIPIRLTPGLRVAQLQVWSSDNATDGAYSEGGKYQAPLGPEGNKLAWESPEVAKLRAISDRMHARHQTGIAHR